MQKSIIAVLLFPIMLCGCGQVAPAPATPITPTLTFAAIPSHI